MNLEKKQVERNIIIKAFELDKYIMIMNNLYEEDISKENSLFQTNFNAFYKVRRDEKWRKVYYDFFEKNKNNKNITFEEILRHLYNNKSIHKIEASFASKMLATINPDKPIWDKYILKNLNINITEKDKDKKLEEVIYNYKIIEQEYEKYLNDSKVKDMIEYYNFILEDYKLSKTKILDYILWCNRNNDN